MPSLVETPPNPIVLTFTYRKGDKAPEQVFTGDAMADSGGAAMWAGAF